MVLHIEIEKGSEKHFVLPDDIQALFTEYPQTQEVYEQGRTQAEAAQLVVDYLSNHNSAAWLSGTDLTKGVRKTLALAASMALFMGATASADVSTAYNTEFGHYETDAFLYNVMEIESSGGTNTEHRLIKHGMHAGQHAVGKWGLMPLTVEEVAARFRLAKSHPELAGQLTSANLEVIFQNDPKLELMVARLLSHYVVQRNGGDLKKSAYCWLMGHNTPLEKLDDETIANSTYVTAFAKNEESMPGQNEFKLKYSMWLKDAKQRKERIKMYKDYQDSTVVLEDFGKPESFMDKFKRLIAGN